MKPHAISRKNLLHRYWGFALVLLAGLGASFGLYSFVLNNERMRIEEEFVRRASVRHALISESLRGYEECLYNLRNLFANSESVTYPEFISASHDIRTRHPGIQAIEWVPVVTEAERDVMEAAARQNVAHFYKITERLPDGTLVPAKPRSQHYPILYIDPLEGNEPALGFDLTVAPSTPDLDKGFRSRSLVMTRKIKLVQDKSPTESFGLIMACPVFAPEGQPERFVGFVQIVFRVDDMIGQSWINYPTSALDTLILDLSTSENDDRFLFGRIANDDSKRHTPHDLAAMNPHRLQTSELKIGGRVWGCYYAIPPGWTDKQISTTPRLVLIGCCLFTVVLGAYFISVRRRAELVEQQVNERTAELRHTQGLLEADIGKRQATEADLRESRRQLDSILGQMPGMAYRYANTSPRTATFISRGSIEIIGHTPSELISGKVHYSDFIHPEDRERHQATVSAALSKQQTYESEYRIHDRGGRLKWVLDRGQGLYSSERVLLFIEGLAINITSRKQAESDKAVLDRKLLESQKLESLGVLAGGIAHDFNNLLTSIVGHASITRIDLPKTSPLQHHLHQIETGAQRAGELCQQMLAYAGKGQFLVQRTHLEKLVRGTTPLLEHSISKRARLRFEFHPGLPEVNADATQIRQIIMNLVVNASDAIGERDGFITIETGSLRRDDPQLQNAVLPPPEGTGDFAFLRVRDTGCGMSADTISKIFDPFYTTKFAGRGLGLAAVLGIVRSHHGSLLVDSAVGLGSTFTLVLPAADPVGPVIDSRPPIETRAHPLAGTVLLIDDEDGVRIVAEQMFAALGLKTLTASDGAEGIELFKKHQHTVSLVLLDLTMPRMSGAETLRALRVLAPRLPVILTSGYNSSVVPELATDECVSFLQKPFSLQGLRQQISKMLN